jgi:MerR family Zn(II)-responsive transcriptional regulator of zntA
MAKMFKIGELAEASGSTIDTIRFYENKGLLMPGDRSESGYRQYHRSAIEVLKFIQMSKELGFSLSEIKDLLEIRIESNGKCSLAFEKIQAKENEIDAKIKDLKRIKKALKMISERCEINQDDKLPCHFLEIITNRTT